MTVPALSETPAPTERRSKPRKPSVQKNVSAKTRQTRQSREIRIVKEDESDGNATPSFMREARFSCAVCGSRSVGKVHPLCDRRRMTWLVKVDRRAKEPER